MDIVGELEVCQDKSKPEPLGVDLDNNNKKRQVDKIKRWDRKHHIDEFPGQKQPYPLIDRI